MNPKYVTHPDFRHTIARVGNPTPAFLDPPLIGSVEYVLSDRSVRVYWPGIGVRDMETAQLRPAADHLRELDEQRRAWDQHRDDEARRYQRAKARPSREDYLNGPND